jgi:hypothetical protein
MMLIRECVRTASTDRQLFHVSFHEMLMLISPYLSGKMGALKFIMATIIVSDLHSDHVFEILLL